MDLNSIFVETSPLFIDIASLVLRVFIGVCFIVHALGKLGIVGPGNMQGFEGWLKSLGLPFPHIQARMAMLSELVGGAMMTLGLLTRVGSLLCFLTMLVAATIGHKGGGYLITNNPPGNEYTINLAAVLAVIFLMGPGRWSLDFLIF